jgi:[ribosomal protein S18]-alanine N-acetyltransferase
MTRFVVRPMRLEDIDAVSEVERECFSTPWPTSAYRRELRDNRMGRYIVLVELLNNQHPVPAMAGDGGSDGSPPGVLRAVEQLFRPFTRAATAPALPTNERIVGFAGMWLMLDEAHVTTIGVKRELRGLGLGEVLFATLLDIATQVGAARSTLEVRVTNSSAQALYRKYGFREEGVRRRYYSDNNEDALIMWSERLSSPEFHERYRRLRVELGNRLGDTVEIQT